GWVRVEWCNGCDGKGITVKWPTEWAKFEGDILPVHKIQPEFYPYAVVTPERLEPRMRHRKRRIQKKWLQRFGVELGQQEITWHCPDKARDKISSNEWQRTVDWIRRLYPNNIAVMIDCHF